MKLVKFVFFLSAFFLAFSCADESTEIPENFIIEFGTECGWCAGREFIKITESKVEYTRFIPCGDDQGTTNKNRTMTAGEWKTLNNSFDYDLFLTLDYDECNVCADGCDEIIRITENDTEHEIRYTPSENVEGLQTFRNKLSEIMKEMRVAD